MPKPNKELIDLYETKKFAFTSKLKRDIEAILDSHNREVDKKARSGKMLTPKQLEVLKLMKELKSVKKVAEKLGIGLRSAYQHLNLAKKKGYLVSDNLEALPVAK